MAIQTATIGTWGGGLTVTYDDVTQIIQTVSLENQDFTDLAVALRYRGNLVQDQLSPAGATRVVTGRTTLNVDVARFGVRLPDPIGLPAGIGLSFVRLV